MSTIKWLTVPNTAEKSNRIETENRLLDMKRSCQGSFSTMGPLVAPVLWKLDCPGLGENGR